MMMLNSAFSAKAWKKKGVFIRRMGQMCEATQLNKVPGPPSMNDSYIPRILQLNGQESTGVCRGLGSEFMT